MKKVLLCFSMPQGTYCGGVATMLKSYLGQKDAFQKHSVKVALFDYLAPAFCADLPSKLNNILYGLLQRRALLRQLKKNPVDMVHIHTSREYLFLKDIWLARAIKRRTGIKAVATVHVGAAQTVFSRIVFARNTTIRWMNQYVDRVIFLTDRIYEEFIEMGLSPAKGTVLGNFHDLQILKKENTLPRKAALQLLFVGAIHREKGIIELLRAMETMSNADIHLDICGRITDNAIQKEFEERTARLGKKVTQHGYVTGQEKAALFQRADALVLPSYHEGFPLVILEALAGGCAVISTAVGATPEVLNDENALWVDIADSESIAHAIHLLKDYPERLEKMQRANLRLSDSYSLTYHIEKLCRIYAGE